MEPGCHHAAQGLDPAAAVTAVANGTAQTIGQAVLTYRAVPEKHRAGAQHPEIVDGLYHGNPAALCPIVHRGRNQHQGIVHMNQVNLLLADYFPYLPVGPGVENQDKGKQQLMKSFLVFQLCIVTGVENHLMAVAFQQSLFRCHNSVLSPRNLVVIMDNQNVHITFPAVRPE